MKRIQKIINSIKQMEGKFFALALFCALIIFGIAAIKDPSLVFVENKEAKYQYLEEVANKICNEKNLIQPLSENLKKYEIFSNQDGTINIKLHSHDYLILDVTMTEEYLIQSIERKIFLVEYFFGIALSCMLIGTILTTLLYMVAWTIGILHEKCKNRKKQKIQN